MIESPDLDVLYRRHSNTIARAIAVRVSRPIDDPDVQDILQTTFVNLIGFLARGNSIRSECPTAFLRTTAIHEICRWSKAKRINLSELPPDLPTNEKDEETRWQRKHDFVAGLKQLDSMDRAVALMAGYHEMDNHEIGRILGISANAVGERIRRARKRHTTENESHE